MMDYVVGKQGGSCQNGDDEAVKREISPAQN
jgi:hypothetical protein